MKKKILLLTLIMCVLGGGKLETLNAQEVVTISGDATRYKASTTEYVPIRTYNSRSYSQSIYLKEELNMDEGASISSISFKVSSSENTFPFTRSKIRVYLTNTELSKFTSTIMVRLSSEDLYYSEKSLDFTGKGWITITLDKAFEYTGKNILVSVWDNTGDFLENTSFESFEPESGDERRCAYCINNSGDPTYNDIKGSLSAHTPQIKFTFTSSGTPSTPTVTLDSPTNGAEDVFNESLEFTVSNATEYQLYMEEKTATGTQTPDPTTPIFGDGVWKTVEDNNIAIHLNDYVAYDGKSYAWKVVVKSPDPDGGTEDLVATSDVFTFTTKNVVSAPGAITDISPKDESEQTSNPALSWTFGDNTGEYKVLFGTTNPPTDVVVSWTNTENEASASYETSDLGANTYYWQVICRNGVGETPSNVFSFTKIGAPDNVTPIYPTDGATGVSTNATLSWTFAPNTTEYKVLWYLSQYSSYDYETGWLPVPQSMEGSYQKSGLSGNTTYKWAIEVRNNAGERVMYENGNKTGDVTEFSFTTSDIQSVSYASPINNTVISTETATLNWNYGSQNTATQYQVLLGTDPDNMTVVKDWTERTMIGTGYETSGSFTTTALNHNSKYYWQVNIKKDETVATGEVVSFISKLDNPVVAENVIYLYPGSNVETSANVAWNAMENIAGYRAYSNGILISGDISNTTSMQVSGLNFNNGNANEVKIVAVYEFDGEQYESSGTIINVYVSGYIEIYGTISNAYNNNKVSEATVTYTGSSALGDDDMQTVTFTTNSNGTFSGYIPAGTYVMSVQAANYKDYTGMAKTYNYVTEYISEDAKMLSNIPDDVTDFTYDKRPNPLLTWRFAENTTHYRVALSTDQNNPEYKTDWIATNGAEEGSYQTSGLASGTTYYVYINVKNENAIPGERDFYDKAPLDTVNPKYYTFTTSSVFPAILKAPADLATIEVPTATLRWQYVGDATEYQVCYGTDADNLTAQGWNGRSEIVGGTGGYVSEDTFTIENLAPATTYYWKVQVRNGVEPIDSEVCSFTTIGLPEAVTDIQPSDEASLQADPKLSWTFGANTEEYQVLLGTTNPPTDVVVDWTSTLATSYQTSVYANIEYYWQVNVRNAFGTTEGAIYSFKKSGIPENVEPIDPTDGAINVSTIVTLTWRFAPNTTHYRVLMDIGNGDFEYVAGSNTTWLEVTDETATFSTDGLGLEANKTYYWAVDVKNAIGTRTKYDNGLVAEFSFTTTDKTSVKYTSPLNDEIMKETTATLQWKYGAGNIVDHYMVYLGKDENNLAAVAEWQERGTASSNSYETDALDNDTRYYWRVDVKYGEDGDVIKGETATFVSLLTVPENLSCVTNVYPDTPFDISWSATSNATSYNIYVDGMLVANTVETTYSYTMTDADYNMTDGHDIQVTAVYEGLGESQKTKPANVKVTGYGTIKGLVRNVNEENVVGATVKLIGVDEFGAEQEIAVTTTNAVGYFEAEILAGTYKLQISDETGVYHTYTETSEFELPHGGEKNFGTVILTSDYIYNFSLSNQKASSVMIILTGGTSALVGQGFDVIVEKDGEVLDRTTLYAASFVGGYGYGFEYSGVWNKPSGSYRIGIRKNGAPENAVTWKNYNRNYHVFIADGDWNEPSNWNNGVVPENSEVHILKEARIKTGDVVNTSNDIIIEGTYLESLSEKFEGSLKIDGTLNAGDLLMQFTYISAEKEAGASVEINGSLSVGRLINDGPYTNLVLNDGGQFRQTGKSIVNFLEGVFNMNIENPTEWSPKNKTGWQFISSPFQNAKISKFVSESEEGDYDLYRYDGTRTKEEWLNEKDKNGITEEEFIQGRAYLASYETAKEVELTGGFCTLSTFDYTQKYDFTYNPDGNLENFHLLGNPFTFNIEWDNFRKSGIVDAYAVVNSKGEYEYYTSGTIKVGDGFFVKTTSSTVQFKYTDNYIATRSREQGNSINIKLHSNAGDDNVIVGFDGREEGFPKLENFNDESATICVLDNDTRYAVVNYDEDVKEVELAFEASKMGLYTIEIEPDGDFDNIVLLDRFTGEETDMLNGNYKFTASNQEDYNRFLIKLGKGQEPANEANFVYQSGNELILNAKGNVQIVDVMGRVVYNEEVVNDVNRIDISALRNSTYIVRVTDEEGTKVTKIVVY